MSDKLKSRIEQHINNHPLEFEPYNDFLALCSETEKTDFDMAHRWANELKGRISSALRSAVAMQNFTAAGDLDALMFRTLVFNAPYFFDDYLQAVEYGKPKDKKFYLPRRHYLLRYVQAYQDILDGKLDFLSVSMPKRSGKAVVWDTLIPTPTGMKKMADIKVGDYVIARNGRKTKVTDVFPQGKVPIYEVRFTDGAVVKTCGNHLWTVKVHDVSKGSRQTAYTYETLSTKQMLDHGIKGGKGRGQHNIYAVPYCAPVEFEHREVKLDPYILGVLIGDGSLTANSPNITNFDKEILDYLQANMPEHDVFYCADAKKSRWAIRNKVERHDENGYLIKSDTAQALSDYGLLGKRSYEKHIPEDYLYNSADVRLELLKGLLDTDGHSKEKIIEYSTSSPDLRDAVMFLVHSLGGRATYKEKMGRYKNNGKIIYTRMSYRVSICFPSSFESPFKVAYKRDAFKPKRDKLYHYIDSITPRGEEEAICIRVDDPEHLFLVSDYFVTTHNSTLGISFSNMVAGKYPNKSILMEGTGDDLVRSFYNGCLEYLQQPNEYHFYDIFPESKLVQTNADTKIINLDKRSRFPTIMCRSIDARQVGLSEATNLLYLDDCVEGREEAKNRQRLNDKWEVISGDVIGRAIEGTPIIICGTRYSIYDPIGRLQDEMKKQNKRMRIIETPALDPITDESNFEFELEGKKIFTTQYFRDQRSMLSAEQWESEFQQQPFEAKGLLFPESNLNRFFELPVDTEPDSIIAVCDTAEKGEDYCSLVVAAIYGEEVYIIDVVFDDSPPEVTKPQCAKALIENKVAVCTFESNAAGSYFAKDVQKILDDKNYPCAIKTKRTITNKQTRIEFASDNIIKNFYFKDNSKYTPYSQYAEFMKQIVTYTRSGKVEHDDAPDSLSLLENELRKVSKTKIEVITRLF